MANAAAQAYRAQAIMTASPGRLIAKLYEAAIRSLRRAIQAIDDNDIEGRWRANAKAADIIEHLATTLNIEQGGEIAANLDRLYSFMIRRLIYVDLHNDPAPARDVIGLLEPLHRAWLEIDKQTDASGAAPPSDDGAVERGPRPGDATSQAYSTA